MGMTKKAAAKLLAKDPDYFSRRGREGGSKKRPRAFDDPEVARAAALKARHKGGNNGRRSESTSKMA